MWNFDQSNYESLPSIVWIHFIAVTAKVRTNPKTVRTNQRRSSFFLFIFLLIRYLLREICTPKFEYCTVDAHTKIPAVHRMQPFTHTIAKNSTPLFCGLFISLFSILRTVTAPKEQITLNEEEHLFCADLFISLSYCSIWRQKIWLNFMFFANIFSAKLWKQLLSLWPVVIAISKKGKIMSIFDYANANINIQLSCKRVYFPFTWHRDIIREQKSWTSHRRERFGADNCIRLFVPEARRGISSLW